MKKKVRIKVFGCCVLTIVPLLCFSQIPEVNDDNWEPSAKLFDEFTSGINSPLYEVEQVYHDIKCIRSKDRISFINDPEDSGDKILVIESKWIEDYIGNEDYLETGALVTWPTYNYTGTDNGRYTYGYFEIRCKFPNDNGLTKPAFWLYAGSPGREIDIFEYISSYPQVMPINLHWSTSVGTICHWSYMSGETCYYPDAWGGIEYGVSPNVGINLYEDYHKYGCEWNPGYINFYFDDKLIRRVDIDLCTSGKDMYSLVNFYQELYLTNRRLYSTSTGIPDNFYIDYVKIWNLKMDCNDPVTSTEGNGFNFNNFNYKVKKSFDLSNTSVPQNAKVTLRATDYFKLDGGFSVPLGSALTLAPTPCH